ncbi:DUF6064 family protein [Tranquillimonas alkanivorans]|uniref:DUF6064 family protein n=1 Tax=Tranquillimonas alkanivorans TaxID=441119 RepID=UPI0024820C12|nr:DUF6064 family protein [Tranquillimonas alkanivorans]
MPDGRTSPRHPYRLLGPGHAVAGDRWLLIVPGVWAAIGGSAAIFLGVPQDTTLLIALALLILVTIGRMTGLSYARHAAADAA